MRETPPKWTGDPQTLLQAISKTQEQYNSITHEQITQACNDQNRVNSRLKALEKHITQSTNYINRNIKKIDETSLHTQMSNLSNELSLANENISKCLQRIKELHDQKAVEIDPSKLPLISKNI